MDDLMLKPVVYLDEGLGAFYWSKEYTKEVGFTPLYTADQMREYARKAVEAEREAIIQMMPGGHSVDPQWVCDEIRARTSD